MTFVLTTGAVTDFGRHSNKGLFTLIAVAVVSTFQHSIDCDSIVICSLNVVQKLPEEKKKTDFSGDNLQSSCIIFFSSKLVSKVTEERWDEDLAECESGTT